MIKINEDKTYRMLIVGPTEADELEAMQLLLGQVQALQAEDLIGLSVTVKAKKREESFVGLSGKINDLIDCVENTCATLQRQIDLAEQEKPSN